MKQTTAIVPITESLAQEFFNSQNIETCLKAIEADATNFIGDVDTAKGRKSIVAKAASIASAKILIDNVGKRLNEKRKKLTDAVNADRKKARDFLDDLKNTVRLPVTEWEEEEEAKKQAVRDAIEYEIDWESALGEDDLFNRQIEIERKEAAFAKAEESRLEKERVEQEKKNRIEYEEQVAKKAKEEAEKNAAEEIEKEKRRVVDEQNRAIAAAKQVEKDKKEALERAERDKKVALLHAKTEEEARLVEEKKMADIKAKNHTHQKKVNREALNSFIAQGVKEKDAKGLITMIAKGFVKNITLNY